MRARRDNRRRPRGFQILDVGACQLLKHVLVAGPLRRIARAAFLRQHPERDAAAAQDVEERTQRLLILGVERAGAAEPHEDLVLRRVERLQAGAVDELRPLIVAESPDVVAALQVVVHGAEVLGSVAVRHQAAPRTDQDRQMLDPDRARNSHLYEPSFSHRFRRGQE